MDPPISDFKGPQVSIENQLNTSFGLRVDDTSVNQAFLELPEHASFMANKNKSHDSSVYIHLQRYFRVFCGAEEGRCSAKGGG